MCRIMSKAVALAVAESLIKHSPEKNLRHIDLKKSFWT